MSAMADASSIADPEVELHTAMEVNTEKFLQLDAAVRGLPEVFRLEIRRRVDVMRAIRLELHSVTDQLIAIRRRKRRGWRVGAALVGGSLAAFAFNHLVHGLPDGVGSSVYFLAGCLLGIALVRFRFSSGWTADETRLNGALESLWFRWHSVGGAASEYVPLVDAVRQHLETTRTAEDDAKHQRLMAGQVIEGTLLEAQRRVYNEVSERHDLEWRVDDVAPAGARLQPGLASAIAQ